MAVTRKTTHAPADLADDTGQGLRLTLQCPKCHDLGIVEWKSLQSSFRCHKCSCQFLIDKSGKVLNQAKLPQVRFACPRCSQSGSIPAMLAVRGVECIGCRLPLAPGPDRQLYGVSEAKTLRQQANLSERRGMRARFIDDNGKLRSRRVAAVSALAVMLAFAAGMLWNLNGDTPERTVRQFTYACLAGDWDDAEALMPEDDVQYAEFRRWRMRYFSSILDEHRPAGDRVAISIAYAVPASDNMRTFTVTLTSPLLGSRSHEQVWQRLEESWRFDAVKTLARTDAAPATDQ